MAKKRKAARKAKRKVTKRKAARRAVKRTVKRKSVKRAAARKTARRRTKRKAKPAGIGARVAGAVGAVLATLTEAEQLHAKTAHKAGFQELE